MLRMITGLNQVSLYESTHLLVFKLDRDDDVSITVDRTLHFDEILGG